MTSNNELVLLRRAKDRIDRDFNAPLNVETIASDVGLSAGHFSRKFREAFGEPPYSYLMTRRVERAMALLRHSERSVTDVCYSVGFTSLGTFSTRFTELVGMPPSAYRERAPEWVEMIAPCVSKRASKPVRNREARLGGQP